MAQLRKISVLAELVNKETGDRFIALDNVFTEKTALKKLTRLRKDFDGNKLAMESNKNKLVVTTAVVFPEPKKYFL